MILPGKVWVILPGKASSEELDYPIKLFAHTIAVVNKGKCAQSVSQKQCHCFRVTLKINVQRLPENLSILSQTFILQCLNVGIYVYSV